MGVSKADPHVFAGEATAKPLNSFERAWKRLLEAAGIKDNVRVHDLRRTFGTMLLTETGDLQLVSKLLNHQNLATTQTYARVAEGLKRDRLTAHADVLNRLSGGRLVTNNAPRVSGAKGC